MYKLHWDKTSQSMSTVYITKVHNIVNATMAKLPTCLCDFGDMQSKHFSLTYNAESFTKSIQFLKAFYFSSSSELVLSV